MRPVSIRPAAPGDAPALEAILLDTFEGTWRPALTPEAAAAFLGEGRAAAYVAARGPEFRVAERDGRVLGFVHWDGDFVHALHVLRPEARAGLGTRLMDHAEAAMARAGHKAARLETDSFNLPSRRFYEGRGYREVGRSPDTEWNSGLTTVHFEKPLAPNGAPRGGSPTP